MVEHTLQGCITAAVLLKLIAGLLQCSCLLKLPTVAHRIDNGTAAVTGCSGCCRRHSPDAIALFVRVHEAHEDAIIIKQGGNLSNLHETQQVQRLCVTGHIQRYAM